MKTFLRTQEKKTRGRANMELNFKWNCPRRVQSKREAVSTPGQQQSTSRQHKFGQKMEGWHWLGFVRREIELWTKYNVKVRSEDDQRRQRVKVLDRCRQRSIQFVGIFRAWISSFLSPYHFHRARIRRKRETISAGKSPKCLFRRRRCTAGRTCITVYGCTSAHFFPTFLWCVLRRDFYFSFANFRPELFFLEREKKTIKGICHNIA